MRGNGFTLIELVIFIGVTAILGNLIVFAIWQSSQKTPVLLYHQIALQTARQCVEWFIGQRQLNGFLTVTCPSTSVPSFCSVPSGYSISVNVSCTTISSDSNYKTVTVTVSGNGNATLSTLLASY